ncbi:MAG: tRNA-dihydrouridine synthase [Spirochaetaceae bacterium]|nr:MAG: tRNA-dihydrouridine synthase [Spirochaetaceae bacterium]
MPFDYQKLPKPFFSLAPMEDITDRVFRQLVTSLGRPDVFYTEFQSAKAISAKRRTTMDALNFSSEERPLIAQIWGNQPEEFYQAASLLAEMGYDGIDINLGCPVRKIVKKGSCAGLIGEYERCRELFQAVREGTAAAGYPQLPVSIKTRSGQQSHNTEEWCGFLLGLKPAALTLHPRTVVQQYEGLADWHQILILSELRQQIHPDCVIIGNGDVSSRQDGLERAARYKIDGVMIGRAAIQQPWIFADSNSATTPPLASRAKIALEHTIRYESEYGERRNFMRLKRFYKAYLESADNKELMAKLMDSVNYTEAKSILGTISDKH